MKKYRFITQGGMLNLGQLIRQAHQPEGVYLVGFGTFQGEVIAGDFWGASAERMPVPNAQRGSWDELLQRTGPQDRIVFLNQMPEADASAQQRRQRAIGVVYDPAHEPGHYVPTILRQRYDRYVFFDRTQALHPLPTNQQVRKDQAKAPAGTYVLIND